VVECVGKMQILSFMQMSHGIIIIGRYDVAV